MHVPKKSREGHDERDQAAREEEHDERLHGDVEDGYGENCQDHQGGEENADEGRADGQSQETRATVKDFDLANHSRRAGWIRITFVGEVAQPIRDAGEAIGLREDKEADAGDKRDR